MSNLAYDPISYSFSDWRAFPPGQSEIARILTLPVNQIRYFIAIAIDYLDAIEGDADLEVDDPSEHDGDEGDYSWQESSP